MEYEKLYKEALERAKQGLPIVEVFPELKESEDERIRKWIVNYIHRGVFNEEEYPMALKAIEWFERQKEQKLAEGTALQKAFISSKTDYTLEEKCDALDYADAILPTSVSYEENEEKYKLHKIIEAAFIAGQKKEQKPEVKDPFDDEQFCRGYEAGKHDAMREQKPAEWSEEDELMRDAVLNTLERIGDYGTIGMQKDWLKSLRPQPHWKPSEEQMVALKDVVETYRVRHNVSVGGDSTFMKIESLYSDLQKLL